MNSPLVVMNIPSPGMLGVNRQESSAMLGPEWATEMTNCVLDEYSRLSSRKGWFNRTSSPVSGDVCQLFEYLDGAGNSEVIFTAGGRIYRNISDPVDITGSVISNDDHWKFQNFNGAVVGWQEGHSPIIWRLPESEFEELSPSSGTIPKGDEVLAAYGRLWALDETGTELHYSDLLIPDVWYDADEPGSAGVIDLKSIWVYGMDKATTIASFNGFLLVFGHESILVFSNPGDPNEMILVENLLGIGCVARDSIQSVGDDLVFLSSSGVRSLSRVVQEKSMPMGDETKNVRNHLVDLVSMGDRRKIKSTYSEKEGFYLLSIPYTGVTICIDFRVQLDDLSRRITEWTSINPTALLTTVDDKILLGKTGVVGEYGGYLDGEDPFRIYYYSGWLSLAEEHRHTFLKNLLSIIHTSSNVSVTYKWAFDFDDNFKIRTKSLTSSNAAEYNEAEYNEAEYSGGYALFQTKIPGAGQGSLIKLGIEAEVQGSELAIQQLGIHARIGRLF